MRRSDFARDMVRHSGISLWRLKYCGETPHEYAMSRVPTNPNKRKGTAICKGKILKDLGLKFFAHSETHAHISARCGGCNLQVDYDKGLCQILDGSACGFDIKAKGVSLSKTLSNKKIFTVSFSIV